MIKSYLDFAQDKKLEVIPEAFSSSAVKKYNDDELKDLLYRTVETFKKYKGDDAQDTLDEIIMLCRELKERI